MRKAPAVIARRALVLEQGGGHRLYMFTLRADEILKVADISRVNRDQTGELIGYQRPEVKKHIDTIVDYLNTDGPILPNAIIMALTPAVRFRSSRGPNVSDGIAASGMLEIPLVGDTEAKPGWIVDGQQRTVALSKTRNRSLPVPVTAFISETLDLQKDQFVRINNTHPLPRGLVMELLPQISTPISPRLSARKLPAELCDLLNRDPASPFHRLIKRASDTSANRRRAVVTDTSIITVLEDSLQRPSGCLFPYRNIATNETDTAAIWAMLLCYWTAVRDTFPEAWGKPPTQSRLMHGVGIKSMGRLMDHVMAAINPVSPNASEYVRTQLKALAPYCHWTDGYWASLGMRWNEWQNVPKHVNMLSNHLMRVYLQVRGTAA